MATRRPSKYFEKLWDCPACGTKSLSAFKDLSCPQCGYVKSPQDSEYVSDRRITDASDIKKAKEGPNWVCSSCGSTNPTSNQECGSCGNPRENTDHGNQIFELDHVDFTHMDPAENLDNQYYIIEDPPPPPRSNPHRVKEIIESARYTQSTAISKWRFGWKHLVISLGVIAVVSLMAIIIYNLVHTTIMEGVANEFYWERVVFIEELTPQQDSGWDLPGGAYNVSRSTRIRDYEPIYEDVSEVIHHDKDCNRDLGSGVVEVYDCSWDEHKTVQKKIGEEPIYDDWYQYTIDQWKPINSPVKSAFDRNPYWPPYTLRYEGQNKVGAQRARKSESYVVIFLVRQDNGETKSYKKAVNFDDWNKYEEGKYYTLEVNNFGMVVNNPLEE